MRASLGRFTGIAAAVRTATVVSVATGAALSALAGCGTRHTPVAVVSSAPAVVQADPRALLSARAAAAKDHRFIAGYTLTRAGRRTQAVMVTLASDGTWRIDVQGGALSGSVDIALVGRPDGQYQCTSATASVGAGCVRIAGLGRKPPSGVDQQVQYPFTTWLDVLTDPTVPVAVSTTAALPKAAGSCFAVEPTTVTLAPPIESATFCYADDGTLTGVRAGFGTLVITGQPTAAPASVPLPAPVVSRSALPNVAPPAPPASGSAAPGATGSKKP